MGGFFFFFFSIFPIFHQNNIITKRKKGGKNNEFKVRWVVRGGQLIEIDFSFLFISFNITSIFFHHGLLYLAGYMLSFFSVFFSLKY